MNILKGFKDMADMVIAAPDLIQSANDMAAEAKQMQASYAAAPAAATAVQLPASAIEAIAGVDLDLYVKISKGIAGYGYDAAMLPTVAASFGIKQAEWTTASAGWAQRIQANPAVGARFNQLYTAV